MQCPQKFAWGHIRELQCEKEEHPGNPEHETTYIQTKLTWLDGDRRSYTGDYIECPSHGCVLPGGHTGNHAI